MILFIANYTGHGGITSAELLETASYETKKIQRSQLALPYQSTN